MRGCLFLAIKGRTVLATLGLLFLALAGYGYFGLFAGEKIIPEQLFAQAINKTLTSKAFRYQVEIRTENQGILSQVEGAWVSPNLVHLQGNMYNTPVEFVQIGETTYMKDLWTKKWLDLKGNKLGQAQLYIMELAPLSFLNYKNILDIRYRGQEKSEAGKMLVLDCRPQLQEPLLREKYREYRCRMWIDPRDRRIRQVLLEPEESAGKNLPTISLKFWDYDQVITIEPLGKS